MINFHPVCVTMSDGGDFFLYYDQVFYGSYASDLYDNRYMALSQPGVIKEFESFQDAETFIQSYSTWGEVDRRNAIGLLWQWWNDLPGEEKLPEDQKRFEQIMLKAVTE